MSGEPPLVLHDYWRSGASYRLRIALNLKGVPYNKVSHDLRQGEQRAADYLAINPQGLVPAIEAGDTLLTQSSAIMEWLEERYPRPPLLPKDADSRAIVRAMAMIVACDIHPLGNLRVLNYLRAPLDCDAEQAKDWIRHWIGEGFTALEQLIRRHGGHFAYGDKPTLADCHLVPQYYAAQRFNVDLEPYPRLSAAVGHAIALEPFQRAHPDRQEGAGGD